MFHMGCGSHDGIHGLLHFRRKAIPATTCSILGRIVHLQTALRSQWDKCQKNNSLFASPSIRRPTPIRSRGNTKNIRFRHANGRFLKERERTVPFRNWKGVSLPSGFLHPATPTQRYRILRCISMQTRKTQSMNTGFLYDKKSMEPEGGYRWMVRR